MKNHRKIPEEAEFNALQGKSLTRAALVESVSAEANGFPLLGCLIPLISTTVASSDMTCFEQFSGTLQAHFFILLCSRGKQWAYLASTSLLAADETCSKPDWATGAQMAGQPGLVTGNDGHKAAIAGLVNHSPLAGQIGVGFAPGF